MDRNALRLPRRALVISALAVVMVGACTSPGSSASPSDQMMESSPSPSDQMMDHSAAPSDEMMDHSAAPSDEMMDHSAAPMIVLAGAFIAGVVTILSPCTLPVVPMVIGASVAGRGRRLAWILVGFASTFVAVTVILASTLSAVELTSTSARLIAAAVLGIVGLTLAVPAAAASTEARLAPVADRAGRWARSARLPGGLQAFVLGGLIGLIWAPCVGPLMAAVIVSAALVGPTIEGAGIAIAYVSGVAIAIAVIAILGERAVRRIGPGARDGLRRSLGAVMVVIALLVATGLSVPVEAGVATALEAGSAGRGRDDR